MLQHEPATGGSASDMATTGTSITLNATAAGNLCARLYDVGFVTQPVLYTMQIAHRSRPPQGKSRR